MKAVTVKGWKFAGGNPALDFVNTVGGRARGAVIRDKLASYHDLAAWSEAAGIFAAWRRVNGRTAARVFRRAVELREALFRLFRKPRRGDLAILNRELGIARQHERVERVWGGIGWRWDDPSAPDAMLWTVARSAAELAVSADFARVRACDGPECGWLFLDRRGVRRWCDMRDCGNRAKVGRFRERRRSERGTRENAYSGTL